MSIVGYFVVDQRKKKRQPERAAEEPSMQLGRPDGEKLPGGLVRGGDEGRFHEEVEEYDPVLRSHCRL